MLLIAAELGGHSTSMHFNKCVQYNYFVMLISLIALLRTDLEEDSDKFVYIIMCISSMQVLCYCVTPLVLFLSALIKL